MTAMLTIAICAAASAIRAAKSSVAVPGSPSIPTSAGQALVWRHTDANNDTREFCVSGVV
ncbi:MAG: hypothetical protein OXG67_08400 [bacterium]|nr:hypothetical protein [bacterium]